MTTILPVEIWETILRKLPINDLKRCISVSRFLCNIGRTILFDTPHFKGVINIKKILKLPIRIIRLSQISGNLRNVEKMSRLQAIIINTSQFGRRMDPSIIRKNQKIKFFISVKHFNEPCVFHPVNYVFENVRLITSYSCFLNISILSQLSRFRFEYLALSHFESFYEREYPEKLMSAIQKTDVKRLIVNSHKKISPQLLQPIRRKIVYISSATFPFSQPFPFFLCKEMPNLEIIDIVSGTIFKLCDMHQLSYSHITAYAKGTVKRYHASEIVNFISKPDKGFVRARFAFKIHIGVINKKLVHYLEDIFVHRTRK